MFKKMIKEDQMTIITSSKFNKFKQTMNELDSKITELEREVFIGDSTQKKQELLTLKAKYKELSLLKAEDGLIIIIRCLL